MQQRKAILGKTALYLHRRIAEGKPLPPTMRRGTPEYVKCSYWQTLNQRCSNGANPLNTERNRNYIRNDIELLMTKSEFNAWVDDHWYEFEDLYAEGLTPSIDRIDSSKGYEPSNMQVIDLKENMRKDRVKPIIGTNVLTGEILTFRSAREAKGFDFRLISRSCKTGINHKGYSWRFDTSSSNNQQGNE